MDFPDNTYNLLDILPFYLEDRAAIGLSDSTVATKERLVRKFVTWCAKEGIHDIKDLNINVLEGFRRHRHKYRKSDGKPLQLSTLAQELMAVIDFMKFLDYYDLLESDFYKKFRLPKVGKSLPKDIPEHEEVEIIFHQTQTTGYMRLRDEAILKTFYSGGMRRQELANLNISNINAKRKTLTIIKGKGSMDRVVPISNSALAAIARYLEELRPRLANISSGDALFLSKYGKRLCPSSITTLGGKYVSRSGIGKKGACHIFRHASATELIRNDAKLPYVQEYLGHLDINSTVIYTHVTINDLSKAYHECHPANK
ncbi:tyrosine-type recombinase/integrase [Kangiella sp. TOML190]|uniref:tyrosine-type recombinase/integrase n=1 Tax=Kangiella sp. TOML190 TaxID=2931351 RepID=UPI00203AB241|nr:tyrosine-type recombinase/integrase [Kangiella sp. TOML190]